MRRYVRLTSLNLELQKLVDEKQLALNTAVELSYLMPDEQARGLETMERNQTAPSLSQAQKMKKLSQAEELNVNIIRSIMESEKSLTTTPPVPPEPAAPPAGRKL